MDLKLEEKFTKDEIAELKKRVFTFTSEMFMEGLSIGREIGKEEFHEETELLAYKNINEFSNQILNDEIWKNHTPYGFEALTGLEDFVDNSKEFMTEKPEEN